ncbi:capsule assembly Wzi family protein [Pedobacter deserti]|uniref:capsule assembly Wzi family protein n=1 Tax=Pedobacter deserti TaxID=2817382 RepID=UPI00210E934A|nr:capsule assembly Wzi family protein [Pedobacter sp. SYSU D00382]
MKRKILSIALIALFNLNFGIAQTLPVGTLLQVEDAFRRQQLLGNDSSNSSFMIRPIFLSEANSLNIYDGDGRGNPADWSKTLLEGQASGIKLLPVVWQQQFTTHHPYGTNDGMMIPAKGYQTLFSAGVFAHWGPLSIQLRPEVVYAQNSDYTKLSESDPTSNIFSAYASYMGSIDMPERFGNGGVTKLGLGQSSIRLTFDPVSIGLSNENLWWGPGNRASLLMSNNAPGFKHITLNTKRPVNTPVGSFEAQLVAGRLENSNLKVPTLILPEKNSDWRYFSGFVFSYQPKWVPGLFLGFDRTYVTYHKELGGFFDYLPIFSAVSKSNYLDDETGIDEESQVRDQRLSLFGRWVMPESNAEVYFQFAKNDHNYNLRDALVEPEHQRAYIAGYRKLVPLVRSSDFIQFGIEFVQLEGSGNKNIRSSGYFYNHGQILHGYTNNGQVIGAGIGSGSNLQSLDISWVRGLKKIGLQFERIVNNNDLFYRAFTEEKNYRRHWVDFSLTGKLDWDFKHLVLSSQLCYVRSLNYQYRFLESPDFFWDWPKQDANNFQVQLGLFYRW